MRLRPAVFIALGLVLPRIAPASDSNAIPLNLPASASIGRPAPDDSAVPAQLSAHQKIASVNRYYNTRYRQESDMRVWGQGDYWASPHEFIARGAGDCEDFAIAKYFHLVRDGVPEDSLRLMIVQHFDGARMRIESHMVLAWYPGSRAEPMILDNVSARIEPLSRRADLIPRLAFNRTGWWTMKGATAFRQPGVFPEERWSTLLARVHAPQVR